ncbi:MAG: hypothetical protein AMXMBFR53_05150 [Gemmatimonadota bacterium]
MPRSLVTLVAAAVLAGCAAEPGSPGQEPVDPPAGPGRLVIVGGALSPENAAVYQAIVEAREGEGPLCVIPTASGDPVASMESARQTLARYAGADAVQGVLLSTEDPGRANAPEVAAELEGCSGFYFTGGAQSRVVDVFLPPGDTTAAYRALWSRWQAGAVVAGSSAGAAMMSRVMIASGGSADAVEHGLAAQEDGEGVRITSGMGFFPAAILDQHFLARGRWGRLLVAALTTDSLPLGLGIDENTALVVDGASGRVVGASGVVVVDGRGAGRVGVGRGTGVRVSLAGAGDVVDLTSFQVRRAPGKVPLPEVDGPIHGPDDPFGRWAFLRLVADLAGSSGTGADFAVGGALLRLREADGFSAAMEALEGGVEGTPAGFSAGPWLVDLVPQG